MSILSLVISIIALVMSIWARIEASLQGSQHYRVNSVKRLGEIMESAELVKTDLTQVIEILKQRIAVIEREQPVSSMAKETRDLLIEMQSLHEWLPGFIDSVDEVLVLFAQGAKVKADLVKLELHIVHFKHQKAVIERELKRGL